MDYSTSRSPSPSSSATIHLRSLVHELQTGHGAAEQLRRRLIRSPDSPPVEDLAAAHSDLDLAEAIVNSLSKSLSIVENCDQSMINARSSSDDCKIEDSNCGGGGGESVRTKDRRGCYKRRRRGQSWTTEGEAPTQDCYAWRKYGQKSILNSQFPRNYYRCTHKTDQGCQAIKHVQKISEDPPRYRTTYSGEHTCKTPLRPSQIILPSSSPDQSDSSFLLSFDRSSNSILNPFFPPSSDNSFAIKEEFPTTNTTTTAQATMMNMTMMMNQASSSDYNHLSSPDLTGGPHVTGLSTPGSDYGGDVISAGTYSCSPSPHSLEIDNYIIAGQDHLDIHPFDCDIIV